MRMRDEISNHLGRLRRERGFSAARLAELAGTSRQTIYAIEAGAFVPNTALALRLAKLLEVAVEDVFALPGEIPAAPIHTEQASLLPAGEAPHAGQPVRVCRVDKRLVAFAPSPLPWYFPASDGVFTGLSASHKKARVHLFDWPADACPRILVAGCDPSISVLARHAQAAGVELALAHRNSSQALALLKQGTVHIAGTHLRDETSGESNLAAVARVFGAHHPAVISYAVWEEGIVTARHNPKGIRTAADLARPDVVIVNREAGSGSRRLLDAQLKRLGIAHTAVRGYGTEAQGHLAAAWQVRSGAADACIATRAAARLFGLGFIPLVSERYDLVVRRAHLDLPPVQALLEILNRASFRRELEALGGYDTRVAGRRVL